MVAPLPSPLQVGAIRAPSNICAGLPRATCEPTANTVSHVQEGLVFSLPGVAIRVAEECSGIRSTLALLIMTVLASHMFLKATWKQVFVCLLAVPLSVAKKRFADCEPVRSGYLRRSGFSSRAASSIWRDVLLRQRFRAARSGFRVPAEKARLEKRGNEA